MEVDSTGSLILKSNAPRMQMIDSFIAFVREVNELLQKEIDLSPANQRVTAIIKRLSLQLRSSYLPEEVHAVLGHAYIRNNQQKLREKLSEAEFLAELGDSRDFTYSEGTVWDIAARLPGWNTYLALVSEEMSALSRVTGKSGHTERVPFVFVGGGPLPLSAIILQLLGDVEVIGLEIDPVAYDASCSLLERLGLEEKVKVVLGNGSEFDYRSYRRIFVASLVRNKREVLEQISRTSPDALVAVRTAEGMKQIMYEAIDESQLTKQGWRILGRTLPEQNLVINSTLFLDRAKAAD